MVRLILAAALATAAPGDPNGTFVKTLSAAELRHAGASSREAAWGSGTWTLVLADFRRWTLRQRGGIYGNAVDAGRIDGDRFTLTTADGFAHNEYVGQLRVIVKRGTLQFFWIAPQPRNADVARILSGRPWKRVK
ncbi:MAG: hypothetical protein E6G08_00930 [Actinobacteria bacterium]|nr:MAG: hypothetical protein E6G08_00930 [Actinomycetota bacterium]